MRMIVPDGSITGEGVIFVTTSTNENFVFIVASSFNCTSEPVLDLTKRWQEMTAVMKEVDNPPLWRQNQGYLPLRSLRSQCEGKRAGRKCRT